MNPIELTQEHKEKLLEMCKALFPEYHFTLDKWKQCFVTFGLKTKDLYEEHIHWFEFCMTHLCKKMGNEFLSVQTVFDESALRHQLMYELEWNTSFHPVDFLYNLFIKEKENEKVK
jgi:hypothetical protein